MGDMAWSRMRERSKNKHASGGAVEWVGLLHYVVAMNDGSEVMYCVCVCVCLCVSTTLGLCVDLVTG